MLFLVYRSWHVLFGSIPLRDMPKCHIQFGNANQKLPFLFSPFGGGVGGGAVQRNGRKFLGLPARVRERGRGAFPRNRSVRKNLKPPRTRSVRSQSGFLQK